MRHFLGVHIKTRKYPRQLINEPHIGIALNALKHLRSFHYRNAGCVVYAGQHDLAV